MNTRISNVSLSWENETAFTTKCIILIIIIYKIITNLFKYILSFFEGKVETVL